MKDVGLAMQRSLKLELISYIGYNFFFLGFCKNIEVVIGELKIKHLIFDVEIRNYDLMLEQSFLNLVRFS